MGRVLTSSRWSTEDPPTRAEADADARGASKPQPPRDLAGWAIVTEDFFPAGYTPSDEPPPF